MSNTNTDSNTHDISSRSSRAEQKNERIRKKSQRIAAKGKVISERNAQLYQKAVQTSGGEADDEPFAPSSPEHEIVDSAERSRQEASTCKPKRKRNGNGFGVAAILSSVSVILLISFALGLMLGIIPSGKKEIVYIYTSNDNNTHEGEYADSNTITSVMSSVVVVSAELTNVTSTGTGFIVAVSEDNSCDYIATNYHVVADANEIYVRMYESGDYAIATLVGYSFEDDIAVLKIAATGLPPLTVANYENCRVGDVVYAIGTPKGENFSWSVTQGIISAVDRVLWIPDDNENIEKTMRVLQTDTPVNPGNSGGPLINAVGEVVGIISMKLDESEGIGFALPIDGALEIISAIIATGSADGVESTISSGRALLGITCTSVTEGHWYKLSSDRITESDAINGSFRAAASGVYVRSISADSAVYGKLRSGDIITEINGSKIYNLNQLSNILYNLKIGDEVTLTYCRNGQYYSASITLRGQS